MISKSFAVMGAVTLLSAVAHAASAPKELYGKSIAIAWNERITGRFGHEQVQNGSQSYQVSIYISTAGRPFVRIKKIAYGSGLNMITSSRVVQNSEMAPGESSAAKQSRVVFEGATVVVYQEFESGAHRIAVDVDGSKTACKATVVNGRQAGGALRQTVGGGVVEISSVHVGSARCSIQEGNVFGQ
jgi:hypothetical protein